MAELKKIYINRGHSNTDPGAVGYVTERKVAVKVGDYMEAYLKENYKCSIRGNAGTVGSLTAISNDANSWGADLMVSIHFNAGGGDGFEALVYDSSRKALGQMFEKYVKTIGQNSRGVKYREDLGILRLTNMPAVLVECAFVDNKQDIKDWDENSELKKMGEALAKAAADYLNLPKKTKTTTTKVTAAKTEKKKYTGTFPKLPLRGYFKRGDSSVQVKYLQKFLNWFGDYKLTVDGVVGSKTITAVEKFQKATGLAVDGLFGKNALVKAKTVKK